MSHKGEANDVHGASPFPLYWLDNPDEKWAKSRARAKRKNDKLEEDLGWRMIVVPLGRYGGIAMYACLTEHSAHVCGFTRSPDGKRLAGCECQGGLGSKFCYHVDEAHPKHVLFQQLEQMSPQAVAALAAQGRAAVNMLLRAELLGGRSAAA